MNHELSTMIQHIKHEIISCDRCGKRMECKANSYTKCQCSGVQLTINEVQYISENYEGCMCAGCLVELQMEYREMMGITV
ncbi:MAG: cysteine-rich CWC family protein [Mucilaginibacter sp.]